MFGYAVAGVFVSFVLPCLKPSYWLSSIFTTIPVWCALFDRRESLVRRLLMAGLPLAAVFVLLIVPERIAARSDKWSAAFLPESLFSIHALIIREQIATDVANPDPAVPYSPEKLRARLALLDDGIASAQINSPRHMASLGYDADWLLYRSPFFTQVAEADSSGLEQSLGFYRYYYRRTWQKMPGPMLQKVGIQLGLFYNLACPAFCNNGENMKKHYLRTDELLHSLGEQTVISAWPPARAYGASVAKLKGHAPEIPMNKMQHLIMDRLSNCYLPGLLAFLATLPWICWRAERRARFGVIAAVLAIGYAFNFGNNLGIAIFHTLQISRYTHVQFATTLLTEMLTGIFLIEMVCAFAVPYFARRVSPSP
jgi:hypothetical protein